MIEAKHQIGERFDIQFVWQLPDKGKGDYIRAVMKAVVLGIDLEADKYIVRLVQFVAGRQESAAGEPRQKGDLAEQYWDKVRGLVDAKLLVAFEAEDGRPLLLRLATLTGEHQYFRRFDNVTDFDQLD